MWIRSQDGKRIGNFEHFKIQKYPFDKKHIIVGQVKAFWSFNEVILGTYNTLEMALAEMERLKIEIDNNTSAVFQFN
jgi:hypothetical protein